RLEERLVAAELVSKLGERFAWPRVVEIFRALDRGDSLLAFAGSGCSASTRSTLLRDERVAAAEIQLALSLELPDEAQARRVITCLTSGQALLEAAVCSELITMPPATSPAAPWFDDDQEEDATVIMM
ncbi:MAG: hypothetical protein ACXW28_07105, partial [Thermoanaerobaculia bacterium]